RDIYPTGFFRQKAKAIRGSMRALLEDFDGEVPSRLADLVTLPGVARKTANVVASELGHAQGIVVDTHVRRLSQRLGLPRQDARGVLPVEPNEERGEKQSGRDHRQLLHDLVLVLGDERLVVVARACEQVARDIEFLAGSKERLVGVGEAAFDLFGEQALVADV